MSYIKQNACVIYYMLLSDSAGNSHKNLAFFEVENDTILAKGDTTMKKTENKP